MRFIYVAPILLHFDFWLPGWVCSLLLHCDYSAEANLSKSVFRAGVEHQRQDNPGANWADCTLHCSAQSRWAGQ